jgi:co-chaperonin GroES (HSP10)
MQPLRDLVLVQRQEKPSQQGLILLPDTAVEESLWVTALAKGSQAKRVEVGKTYLLRQWCGFRLEEEKGFQSPLLVPQDLLEAVQEDG